jgi:hypothetical protein
MYSRATGQLRKALLYKRMSDENIRIYTVTPIQAIYVNAIIARQQKTSAKYTNSTQFRHHMVL